jgi:hypothetical protein
MVADENWTKNWAKIISGAADRFWFADQIIVGTLMATKKPQIPGIR